VFVSYQAGEDAGRHTLEWLTGILNPVGHTPRLPDYSFSDLVSLFVVRELLRKGVRPRTIQKAERYLRRKLRTDRPFVNEMIATDGQLYRELHAARSNRVIEAATRRFGYAADRLLAEDEIVDLVIAAESLFLGRDRASDRPWRTVVSARHTGRVLPRRGHRRSPAGRQVHAYGIRSPKRRRSQRCAP